MKVYAGTGDKEKQKTYLDKENEDHEDPSSEYHPDPFVSHVVKALLIPL
jgi:hypothetical protein